MLVIAVLTQNNQYIHRRYIRLFGRENHQNIRACVCSEYFTHGVILRTKVYSSLYNVIFRGVIIITV